MGHFGKVMRLAKGASSHELIFEKAYSAFAVDGDVLFVADRFGIRAVPIGSCLE
jgi:hypothetical protein